MSEHPYPAKDKICFYLRTYSGLRMIEADANSVESGKDKYSPLFGEGQMVLTALRIAAE